MGRSVAFTPYNRDATYFTETIPIANPNTAPKQDHRKHSCRHKSRNISRLSTQRNPCPKLSFSLQHRVAQYAIQSNHRQQQGNSCKE